MRSRLARTMIVLAVGLTPVATLRAAEITQHFPADGPAGSRVTRWRVEWGIESHAGGSETLVIRNAWFSRSPGAPEVRVLGDTRLADVFVPYHNGTRIYDISNFSFSMSDLSDQALGPRCIAPGTIRDRAGTVAASGPVAIEVHDDSARWMDTLDRVRRGQKLQILAALDAANYRYIMLYEFNDDGSVGVRLGATASNLFSDNGDGTTHLHSGLWRISPVLDDDTALKVGVVELDTAALRNVVRAISNEADEPFQPTKFTRIRVESTRFRNDHNPPNYLSYELVPRLSGTGRYHGVGEEFTRSDFWIAGDPSELRPRDLPSYSDGETLVGTPVTLWHMAGVCHAVRDEDFGRDGYDSSEGVAITAWAGFDLKPRNFFSSTPLFP